MATASGKYAEFDEYIDYQVQKTRTGIKWTDLLTAGVGVAVFVLAYLLLFTLLDHWVVPGGFSVVSRAIMLALVFVVAVGWMVWKVAVPWFRRVTGLYAARTLEEADPQLKSAVLNLVDVKTSRHNVQAHVLRAMEKRAAVRLAKVDVDQAVDRTLLMRFAYLLLALVVICCVYTVLSPKRISFLRALTVATADVSTQTEILEVSPGDVEVIAGTRQEVIVDLGGDLPERVVVNCTTKDRSLVDEPVELRPIEDEAGRFRGVINGPNGRGITEAMTYQVVAGDAESRVFNISVLEAPSATVDELRLDFPAYMEFAPQTRPGGHIETWEGTRVRIRARSDLPVKSALIQFADDAGGKAEELRMDVARDGLLLTGEWTANRRTDGSWPRHYRILVRDAEGRTDPNPMLYNIEIRPDLPPEVELIAPAGDLEMPANGVVPLMVQAKDPDFKLRSLTLKLEKEGEELPPDELIFDGLTNGYRESFTGQHELKLARRHLLPGDRLVFHIEARDNKPPLGNKATTPPLTILIVDPVSEDQVQEQLKREKKVQQEKLAERQAEEEQQSDEQQEAAEDSATGDEREEGESGEEGDSSGTESSPGGEDGQKSDQTDREGANGQQNEQSEDSQGQGATGQERTDKADEDEALQKMIERMRERQQQDTDDSQSDTDARQDDDQSDTGASENASNENSDNSQDPNSTDGSENKQTPGESDDAQKQSSPDPAENSDGDKDNATKSDTDNQDENEQNEAQQKGLNDDGTTKDDSASTDPDKTGGDSDSKDAKPGEDGQKQDGQEQDGQEQDGQKQDGQKQDGQKQDGQKQDGQKQDGQKQDGQKQDGQEQDGQKQDGQEQDGQKQDGQKQDGQEQDGQKQDGQKQDGQEQDGQEQDGQKQDGQKQDGQKQDGQKQDGQKQDGQEQDGQKQDGQKQDGQKQDGQKQDGQKQDGQKQDGQKQDGQKQDGQKQDGQKQDGQKQDGQKQDGQKQDGQKQDGQKQDGQKQDGQKQDGQKRDEQDNAKKEDKNKGDGASDGEEGGTNAKSQGEGEKGRKGSPGGKQASPPTESPGAKGSESSGSGGFAPRTSEGSSGNAGSGGSAAGPGEDPNLEDAKKAANLVLKGIEDQLDRKEIDEELLKELGWTEDDLRKFSERLRKRLTEMEDEQAAQSEQQRRQFEEMLRSLDLRARSRGREGSSDRDRLTDGVNTRNSRPPADFRDIYEAYSRSISGANSGNRSGR